MFVKCPFRVFFWATGRFSKKHVSSGTGVCKFKFIRADNRNTFSNSTMWKLKFKLFLKWTMKDNSLLIDHPMKMLEVGNFERLLLILLLAWWYSFQDLVNKICYCFVSYGKKAIKSTKFHNFLSLHNEIYQK